MIIFFSGWGIEGKGASLLNVHKESFIVHEFTQKQRFIKQKLNKNIYVEEDKDMLLYCQSWSIAPIYLSVVRIV